MLDFSKYCIYIYIFGYFRIYMLNILVKSEIKYRRLGILALIFIDDKVILLIIFQRTALYVYNITIIRLNFLNLDD